MIEFLNHFMILERKESHDIVLIFNKVHWTDTY